MSEPIVAVRGEINREVPPEVARVTVTIGARHREREATLTRLAERSAGLKALTEEFAQAIERRETSGVSVYPDTRRSGERVIGYRGSIMVELTVVDFTVLGDLMVRLADQDQARVDGPWWGLRPDSPVYRQARHDAIGDAVVRAREYAEALGARITRLILLADAGLSGANPVLDTAAYGGGQARAMSMEDSGGVPAFDLEPRLQHVYASVEARFAMTEPDLS